jgi:hypothetical protein
MCSVGPATVRRDHAGKDALFHGQVAVMPQPTEVRAFKWKGPGPIGRDFYGNCFALWQLLVNVKGFQLESMIPVERCNDQFDAIASLCFDYVLGKPYFLAVTLMSLSVPEDVF